MADRITGSVLDFGCEMGENAHFFASRGQRVTGIDFLPEPIRLARQKATERGLEATFLVMDALARNDWLEGTDNVLFGVWKDSLSPRIGPDASDDALLMPHVEEFDITRRSTPGRSGSSRKTSRTMTR